VEDLLALLYLPSGSNAASKVSTMSTGGIRRILVFNS